MRAKRMEQRSIFDSAYPDHDTGRALAAISDLLDGHLVPRLDRPRHRPGRPVAQGPAGPAPRGRPALRDPEASASNGLPGPRVRPTRLGLGGALHPRGPAGSPEALGAAAWKIPKARGKRKVRLYRELLVATRRTLGYAKGALAAVEGREEPWLERWRADVARFRELGEAVVDQTVRRVLEGGKVPAGEKW